MTTYRTSHTLFRLTLLAAVAVLFLLPQSAMADHKTVIWNGDGDGVSYSDPDNWDIDEVPINDGTHTYNVVIGSSVAVTFDVGSADVVTDLSLGGGSTLTINSGKSLTVLDDADIYGYITTDNGAFTAIAAAARFPGNAARLNVSGGGTIGIGATTYSSTGLPNNYTLMSAQGAGSMLNLSSLATLNAGFNDNSGYVRVHTISATTGGIIDLSGVTEIIGPYRGEDRLDLIIGTPGGINLDSLLTTSGSGMKLFDINVASYSLPLLQTAGNTKFDVMDAGQLDLATLQIFTGGNFTMGDNATVNATSLTSFNNSSLTFGAGATFNAPNLVDVSSSVINIAPGQTLTMGTLININNARLAVSDGETFGTAYGDVSATAYSSTGLTNNYTLFSANGGGSVLDLSSLQSINAGFNDNSGYVRVHTISASAGGLVDLSGVTSITAPYRSEDRLDVTISGGGDVNLDALQGISGTGQTIFSINDADYSLPALQTAGNTQFNVATLWILDVNALTSHDRGGYNLGAGATVNAGSLATLTNASVTMDTGATFNAPNLIDFSRSTVSLQPGMNFNTAALSNIDNARLAVAGGLNYNNVSATAYSSTGIPGSYTLFSADGAGSVLDLSSLTSINAGFNDNSSYVRVHTISASAGGLVDLSDVTTITAPYRSEDRLDVTVSGGGNVNLDGLQGISGTGQTRFSINDADYSLPALQTTGNVQFNVATLQTLYLPVLISHDRGGYNLGAGATVNAGALTTLTNATVTLNTESLFNAPNLVDFSNSTISLQPEQYFVTAALSDIDNARLAVSGGVNYSNVSATAYSSTGIPGTYTLFSADGAGSVLDLSSLQSIDAGFNDNSSYARVHTIIASAGGLVDLSDVATIIAPYRSEDRLDVTGNVNLDGLQGISGTGQTRFSINDSNYSLPALQTVGGAKFNVAASRTLDVNALDSHDRGGYDLTAGAIVNATSLAALTNASVTMDTGATFNAPSLVNFSGSTIALGAGQNFITGTLGNIDSARLAVSGGANYSNISAIAYSSTSLPGTYTLFSADGAGSVLDLSSLTSINAGFNDNSSYVRVHTISATAGGLVDLSNVTSITAPYRSEDRLDFIINGGEIDLRSLRSVSGSPNGQTKFTVSGGGKLTFGNMTFTDDFQLVVSDDTSSLEITGNLHLDPTSSLSITGAAKAQIGGNFSFDYTDETKFDGDTAIFQLAGVSDQWLEVGGHDDGVSGCTSGNFGIGQLIVGSGTQTSTVLLADAIDNGNRGSREALYLFGFGGPDGLRILNGSTLVIGDIPLYALLDGEMTDIHSLFGTGITEIEFKENGNDGYIVIPEPATLTLLGAGASLMLLRRRRRA